jgi:hypothetical protein
MLMGPEVPFLGGPPEAACGLEPLCTAAAPLLCPQGWEEPSAGGGADISVPPPPASTSKKTESWNKFLHKQNPHWLKAKHNKRSIR